MCVRVCVYLDASVRVLLLLCGGALDGRRRRAQRGGTMVLVLVVVVPFLASKAHLLRLV